jgi:predicted component of type VI protein secretion system
MRATMAQAATKDDLSGLATKTDLARIEAKLEARLETFEVRFGKRIDVLRRVFKDNHRVLTKRMRAVESRIER